MRHDQNADRSRADTLKIKSIRAVQPASPSAPNDWRTSLGQILVTVETDDGLTGFGVGGGGRASIHVVETVIRRALAGQDSTDVEGLWQAMYSLTLAYGRKGIAIMAISGVDLALWNLRAKRASLLLAQVLGDELRPSVPGYRTGRSPEAWINEGTDGFTARKLSLAMSGNEAVGDVVDRLWRVRRALGPDVQTTRDAFCPATSPGSTPTLPLPLVFSSTGLRGRSSASPVPARRRARSRGGSPADQKRSRLARCRSSSTPQIGTQETSASKMAAM